MPDPRAPDALRPVTFQRGFTSAPSGSVLVSFGRTMVLCTAIVQDEVPSWLKGKGQGWLTAEYSMLPGSSPERKQREATKGRQEGRTQEIQRLIGRSLRAVVDLAKCGERTIWIDCDVLQADGGTRTAAITGAYVALHDALKWMERKRMLFDWPMQESVAAVSVGIVDGKIRLDLDYVLDSSASVDLNLVMTGSGRFVEVQGSGEEATFSADELAAMLALGRKGIDALTALQKQALAR